MLSSIKHFVEKMNLMIGYCSGLGIMIMGIILFYEVIARYFFNSPTIWAQEIAIYLFIWTMLAGAAYTLQVGKHVRIDLFLIRLSRKTQDILEFFTSILGTVFSAYVAFQGWHMLEATLKYGKLSATPLRMPLWIPHLALLVGFSILTLQFIILTGSKFSAVTGQDKKESEQSC